jgi:NitT/TauT family transport system substrate-binding protein
MKRYFRQARVQLLRLHWVQQRFSKLCHRLFQPITVQMVVLAVATGIIAASCVQPPFQPLRIGTNVWPGYEPLYLARDLNYYGDMPIKFLESTFIAEHSRMFLNGNLEMLSTTLDSAFELAASEPQTRIFALLDISDGADAVLAQPQIQTLAELKGKRIGVQNATLGKLVLTRALEKAGLSEQAVQIVSLDVPEQEAAFKTKRVDAVVTFEPVRSKLLAAKAKRLFDSSQMPGEIVDVLIGRADLIKSHPQQLRSLLQGWYRALDYTQQHPQDAAQRMAVREKITPAQFTEASKGLRFVSFQENQQFFQQKNSPLFQGMTRLANFLRQHKLLEHVAEPASLLEGQPLSQIEP